MGDSLKESRIVRPMTVLAIIVIYRRLPIESPSLITLIEAAAKAEGSGLRLKILLADNTPGGQPVSEIPAAVEYRAYPNNPGLAQPYNEALALAVRDGFDWLLTLDQDTELPPDFFEHMIRAAQRHAEDETVAAVAPRIVDRGRMISPFCFRGAFLPKVLPATAVGIAPAHASALNSGSLVRVRSLEAVGGYDAEFPLHNSDTRLYQQLDRAGLRVAVAEVTVPHELSILRREERMSPERYRHMLRDECRFWDRHMGLPGRVERMVRLLGRYVKGWMRKEDAAFQRITAAELRFRLLTRRKARLKAAGR